VGCVSDGKVSIRDLPSLRCGSAQSSANH
jgi:hypothetical protein